jgi:cellulose synthase/poly-beta-1,6-N-acetylglucosamine synthase-like glycosyltransferase
MITRQLLEGGGFNLGYLLKAKSVGIQPSFATANMAVRREVLQQIGDFDENCITGEDFDLNLRVLNTQWECYYEPRAKIRHRFRADIRALLQQWYGYAFSHPMVIKKYMPRVFEIFIPVTRSYTEVVRFPFPARVVIRLNSFYLFHCLFLAGLLASTGSPVQIGLFFLCALAGAKYFFRPFSFKHPAQAFYFILLRYLVNQARFWGGFLGGLTQGMLFFEETWNKNVLPEKIEAYLPKSP